jgi:hypothetical protein
LGKDFAVLIRVSDKIRKGEIWIGAPCPTYYLDKVALVTIYSTIHFQINLLHCLNLFEGVFGLVYF